MRLTDLLHMLLDATHATSVSYGDEDEKQAYATADRGEANRSGSAVSYPP